MWPGLLGRAAGGVLVESLLPAEPTAGGVEDSYPELAAGEESDPWDSCT